MKHIKKLASLALVLVMALSLSVTASAAEATYTITINNDTPDHAYEAYQIFTGDLSHKTVGDVNTPVLSNIQWGNGVNGDDLLAALKSDTTLGNDFTACDSAAAVAEVLTEYTYDSVKTQQFAKLAGANLSTTTSGTFSAGQDGKTYTISGLAAGYYLVKDKDNSVTGDDTYTRYILQVVDNVTTQVKSSKPTLDKQVKHGESWGNVSDAQIGDTVNFRTTSTVPNTTGYTNYTYIITDTMSTGLTSNVKDSSDVTIKVNDDDTLSTDYYTVTADGNTFTLTIYILKGITDGKFQAGNTLYAYYSGVLNESAKIYDTGKEDNTANLQYSNNPNDTTSTAKTPDEKVYVWTFQMGINKVDGSQTPQPLTGAKFVLSTSGTLTVADMQCNDGVPTAAIASLIKLVKVNDSEYRIATETDTNTTYVIDAGNVTIKGLDAATYYLYETKAPVGHNLLNAPVNFTITAQYNTDGSALEAKFPKASMNGGEASEVLSMNVINNAGSTLPETGGMGTTIFYALGGVLVLAAVVLLVTRKRMNREG